jgi:hypothetical protein
MVSFSFCRCRSSFGVVAMSFVLQFSSGLHTLVCLFGLSFVAFCSPLLLSVR